MEVRERRRFYVLGTETDTDAVDMSFGELLHLIATKPGTVVNSSELMPRERELVSSVIAHRDNTPPSSRVRRSDLEQAVIRAAMALVDADGDVGIQEEALVAHLRATVNELRRGGV